MRLRDLLEVSANDIIVKYREGYVKIKEGIFGDEKDIFKDDFLNNEINCISIENDCLVVDLELYL